MIVEIVFTNLHEFVCTNLGFHVQVRLPGFEDRPNAYRALCEVWASPEFQEKSQRKRNSGTSSATHTFGGDGYVRLAKRMVTHRINFLINISIIMCY